MIATTTVIVGSEPSWGQILVPALASIVAILAAAVIGARLGARWTMTQTLELHRTQRQQDALLRFLDLVAKVDLAMRRALPGRSDPSVHWSEAVEGVGGKMLREHPGVTWDRSNEPDEELHQWGKVVGAILDAEEEWRGHLAARVNHPEIASRWAEILDAGARLGLKGTVASSEQIQLLHGKLLALMDEVRTLT